MQLTGAKSWFNIGFLSFQPSEIGKVFFVLFLSSMIVKVQKGNKKNIDKIGKLGLILLTALFPIFLIALEPDYGTAIAYLLALILMLFVSGVDKKYIFITIALALILLPLLYFFILPAHAKARIDVFLNSNLDPRGAGYNIIQSKLAIGARKIVWYGLYARNTNTFRISIS